MLEFLCNCICPILLAVFITYAFIIGLRNTFNEGEDEVETHEDDM